MKKYTRLDKSCRKIVILHCKIQIHKMFFFAAFFAISIKINKTIINYTFYTRDNP